MCPNTSGGNESSDIRYRDKSWLKKKYHEEGLSQYEIGDLCGCSPVTISNWLLKFDIETREANKIPDERLKNPDWLREQYVDKELTQDEVADLCGCSAESVRRALSRNEIQYDGRGCSEYPRSNSRRLDERLYDSKWLTEMCEENGKTISEIADMCDCDYHTARYYLVKYDVDYPIDRSGSNNRDIDQRLKDPEWMEQKYVQEKKSTLMIAEECGCGDTTVSSWLRNHGIEVRDYSQITGEMHPRWKKDSRAPYGDNWREQRQKALDRDNYSCQDCGAHDSEFNRSLHVHHIMPRSNFVTDGELDYKSANQLSNLISLCPSCHPTWEKFSPLRPT